ncbi:MAG: putative membrane protein [Lysobacterales bacterium]|jgi:uncharacterized membrane protein
MQTLDRKFRFDSIDQLRGLVIVLMALDHVRDFWTPFAFQPENLELTSPELFFTRWVTHFCAPVFIFLTGMSAFLFENKGNSKATVRNFLITRGIWLVFIEFTVVNLSWKFSFAPWGFGQVIWAIGVSMLALSALIYLPKKIVFAIGVAMIAGHNLLDPIQAESFGSSAWIWNMLHQPGMVQLFDGGFGLFFAYPLIPWIGVMAVGYASAPWFFSNPQEFSSKAIKTGLILSVAFVLIRYTNWYGDPEVWTSQARGSIYTFISFLNLQKYPPSLLYLLMTLGPALMLLGYLQKANLALAAPFTLFGRVPFFFYVIHVAFLHAVAMVYFGLTIGSYGANWQMQGPGAHPAAYEPSLLRGYIAWVLISIVMYYACRWFAGVKQRHDHWVLKYL